MGKNKIDPIKILIPICKKHNIDKRQMSQDEFNICEKEVRGEFCSQLVKELSKLKGKDLESCLSEIVLDKKKKCTRVTLEFKI